MMSQTMPNGVAEFSVSQVSVAGVTITESFVLLHVLKLENMHLLFIFNLAVTF